VTLSLGAVVVNHDAGEALLACVASLRAEGVGELVVVDNASTDGSVEELEESDPAAQLLRTGRNLGYGAGANRGLALVHSDLVLVCNPDVVVHPGALGVMAAVLSDDPAAGVVGPRILEPDGSRYPSARRFPSWSDALGHALLGALRPSNRFTQRYRMADIVADRPSPVDWVSGACFLARRRVLEEVGGFDERYFMYLEDTDLCWRLWRAGYRVLYVPGASVSHLQGLSTAKRPYRMLVAHHRSAFRFAVRSTSGWRRAGLPAVALLLIVRLVVLSLRQALSTRRGGARGGD
jgi:N-acetylglucosaminyl-diphospho-decaprenol L-rhamnosyltransferase